MFGFRCVIRKLISNGLHSSSTWKRQCGQWFLTKRCQFFERWMTHFQIKIPLISAQHVSIQNDFTTSSNKKPNKKDFSCVFSRVKSLTAAAHCYTYNGYIRKMCDSVLAKLYVTEWINGKNCSYIAYRRKHAGMKFMEPQHYVFVYTLNDPTLKKQATIKLEAQTFHFRRKIYTSFCESLYINAKWIFFFPVSM